MRWDGFPDDNAAEALRRIPGVSMDIDQGEGRFVIVRGVDASLNNVTINGQIVGTPAEFGTRGVSMDSVPADLISRLEVTKAVTPDMDANAIGASINIATRKAFDRPGGFFSGNIRSGYNEMSGRAPYSGNVSFGRVLGEKQRWGFVAGASYSYRRYDTQLLNGSSDTWTSFNGLPVPHDQTKYLYDVERQRQGVNVSLEFRPARGHALTLGVQSQPVPGHRGTPAVVVRLHARHADQSDADQRQLQPGAGDAPVPRLHAEASDQRDSARRRSRQPALHRRLEGRREPRAAPHAEPRGLGVPIRRERVSQHLRHLRARVSEDHAARFVLLGCRVSVPPRALPQRSRARGRDHGRAERQAQRHAGGASGLLEGRREDRQSRQDAEPRESELHRLGLHAGRLRTWADRSRTAF